MQDKEESKMRNEREDCKTLLICEEDAYKTRFSAVIKDVRNEDGKIGLELDRTAFFPEGGGQSADEGTIEGVKVIDVQRNEGRVWHYLSAKDGAGRFETGQQVTGEVDFEVRFRRMQNHLAEHLFCGIAHTRFGYDNVGFHLSDVVTFDLDGPLTKEEILSIEEKCNEAVWENVSVKVHFPTPEEIEKTEFRSKLELSDGVRLVEIEGYDLCACCAPALRTTGEIGTVKVIDFMPHRGGTRITMIAGSDAYFDYRHLDEQQKELMKIFSAKRGEIAKFAEEYVAKTNAIHEEILSLKKEIVAGKVLEIKQTIKEKNTAANHPAICFFMENADEVMVRNVINECVKDYDGVICGFRGNDKEGYRYVCGRKTADEENSLKTLAVKMKEAFGGRGGGSEIMIQGAADAPRESIRKFFDED